MSEALLAAKEEFVSAVCGYLQQQSGQQTFLSNLNSTATQHDNDGHPIVTLRPSAAELDFSDELSEQLLDGCVEAAAKHGDTAADPEVVRAGRKRKAGGHFRNLQKSDTDTDLYKLLRTGAAGLKSQPCRFFAVGKCRKGQECPYFHEGDRPPGGYKDIIWTPETAEQKEQAKRKEWELARAIFDAVQSYDGEARVSCVGSDYHVVRLRKEPQFKSVKLLDFIRDHESLFEIVPDPELPGQFLVTLQPGAEAGLPDAEERLTEDIPELELLLPERIEDPQTDQERMQALRIEILHALASRGGRCSLQELGTDPRVQRGREKICQAKVLSNFVKLFPMNFVIEAQVRCPQNAMVAVSDYDVRDEKAIELAIRLEDSRPHGHQLKQARAPAVVGRPLVLVLGMPKCGTTSLHEAFLSIGLESVHWALDAGADLSADKRLREWGENAEERLIANLVTRAVNDGLPPLFYLPESVNAVAEMNGLVWVDKYAGLVEGCFPQMSFLSELVHHYPHAHFILNKRDPEKWLQSVNNHNDMRKRFICADLPGLPEGVGRSDNELIHWVTAHHRHVCNYLRKSRAKLLVFDIDRHGERELSDFLGHPVVWGHHNETNKGRR